MAAEWSVPGYRQMRDLGTGGTGRVALAVETASGTPVAIKYLDARLLDDQDFLKRFRREAALLAGLRHAHITRLHRYVESPEGAAIVMDFVDGVSLADMLRREGRLPVPAALVTLKGSLLALAEAHEREIVHRDYKPANVLVAKDGTSKLVDFGIAVHAESEDLPAGTPAYMAPEQWEGAPAVPATDVYAATAVFFECVTGHRPYSDDDLAALRELHLAGTVPAREVPWQVRGLVNRGMAKAPADRPAGAWEFLRELEECARRRYGPGWEQRGIALLSGLAVISAVGAAAPATSAAKAVGGSLFGHRPPGGTAVRTGVRHLKRLAKPKAVAAVTAVGLTVGAVAAAQQGSGRTTPSPSADQVVLPAAPPSPTSPSARPPALPTAPPSAPPSPPTPSSPPAAASAPASAPVAAKPSVPSVPSVVVAPPASAKASAPATSGSPTKSSGPTKVRQPHATTAPSSPPQPTTAKPPSQPKVPPAVERTSPPEKQATPQPVTSEPSTSMPPEKPHSSAPASEQPTPEPSSEPETEPSTVPTTGPSAVPSSPVPEKPHVRPTVTIHVTIRVHVHGEDGPHRHRVIRPGAG